MQKYIYIYTRSGYHTQIDSQNSNNMLVSTKIFVLTPGACTSFFGKCTFLLDSSRMYVARGPENVAAYYHGLPNSVPVFVVI